MDLSDEPKATLDLTHVLYDASSHVSLALALITLSPILLMVRSILLHTRRCLPTRPKASYAILAVFTRELTIINMWAGQLLCEGFNWVIKRLVKEQRPAGSVGNGYGFPSSHSQYMAYFALFLVLHFHFRHRFVPFGSWAADKAFTLFVHVAFISWAVIVAYSRYYLSYHSIAQVLWGVSIGLVFGGAYYLVTELIPMRHPKSMLGRGRVFLLSNPVSTWLRIRDGWDVWADSGTEEHWQLWRKEWERRAQSAQAKKIR
ncbi:PAP2-domain-containing protein [Amylostereum chailletii]|nr:PAP2-domain-containing protein [Amylostereum chailletii]